MHAQILALLHEFGHLVDLLPTDEGDQDGKSVQNTSEVLRFCRAEVEYKARRGRFLSRALRGRAGSWRICVFQTWLAHRRASTGFFPVDLQRDANHSPGYGNESVATSRSDVEALNLTSVAAITRNSSTRYAK